MSISSSPNSHSLHQRRSYGINFHWNKVLSIVSLLLLVLLLPLPSIAQEGNRNNDKKDVSSFRIKIRRLQQGISTQESAIETTKKQERNLLHELEILDKRLAVQQTKLEGLEVRLTRQQHLIEKETATLKTINSEKSIVENHLQRRIKAYYTMGDIGLLNVTFSTQTLPELLQFHDAFDSLIKYDQDVIKVYRETINDLERAKETLTLEKSILQNFIDMVLEEKAEITQTKTDKESLLVHIRTQEKLHRQAIKEMTEASADLSETLVSIKHQNELLDQVFLINKGNHPPPVDGIIISLFQQEKINKLGISRKPPGISLRAVDGTKVKAISEGTVIFSGYLRGYGNTIIIHHGYQYYTVTSRIEKVLVGRGDTVKTEDIIGIMGDTATLFDEGLYFEIRHSKQSLDPLLWLNPNRLSAAEEQSDQ